MSNERNDTGENINPNNGFDFNNPERDQASLLKEFWLSAKEIDDLIQTCLGEHHLKVGGYEVKSLIREWKSLYFLIFGVQPTQNFFDESEIGKFIAQHAMYEEMIAIER